MASLVCDMSRLHQNHRTPTRFILPSGTVAGTHLAELETREDKWIRSRFFEDDNPGNYANPDYHQQHGEYCLPNAQGFTITQLFLIQELPLIPKIHRRTCTKKFGQTNHQHKLLEGFHAAYPQVSATHGLF